MQVTDPLGLARLHSRFTIAARHGLTGANRMGRLTMAPLLGSRNDLIPKLPAFSEEFLFFGSSPRSSCSSFPLSYLSIPTVLCVCFYSLQVRFETHLS